MRTLSTAALQSALDDYSTEVWLVLLEATHADLPDPIRVVRNYEDIESNGDTYVAFPFEIELPDQDAERPSQCKVTIDNVSREILTSLRSISSPADVAIRVVLASQPDTVEIEFTGLKLRNIQYDAGQITGELLFEDVATEPVSKDMTPQWFPGLF